MGVSSYRDLRVWQLGMELAKEVYLLTQSFPQEERYGLRSQVRDAAVSIPSNIAEGHARGFTKEFLRFISIATGSLAELETQLLLAESLGYCDKLRIMNLLNKCTQESKMLSSLRRRLQAKLAP